MFRSKSVVPWRKLIPASLILASAILVGITLSTPRPAATQSQCCLGCSGELCYDTCERKCSDGSCCTKHFYYEKTGGDSTPQLPELQ